ncbi:MAG: hypothetical protein C5B50_22655 [Verrucomicrobia bacterium]|nr:MAG: hypothetical protein C5B50_22655 [Verrucomicrobiota bacterium]
MIKPPDQLDGAKVTCFALVTAAVKPTAATTHRRDSQVLGPACGLAICQYPDDSAFYLFYCDENWAVRTDTFHLTLENAKSQAEFEYKGIRNYWKDMA